MTDSGVAWIFWFLIITVGCDRYDEFPQEAVFGKVPPGGEYTFDQLTDPVVDSTRL